MNRTKIWKELLRHGVWITVVALLLFKQCSINKDYETKLNEANQGAAVANNVITVTQDKLGRAQYAVESQEVNFKKLLQSKDEELTSMKRDVRNMRIKLNAIQSVTKITAATSDTIKVQLTDTLIYLSLPSLASDDTIQQAVEMSKFFYQDEWLTLGGLIGDTTMDMSYTVLEDLLVVSHTKRNGIFGKKYLITEVVSNNPNSRLTGLKQFRTKVPRPILTVSVQVGAGLSTNLKPGFYAGIGVGYPIWTIYNKKR